MAFGFCWKIQAVNNYINNNVMLDIDPCNEENR